MSTTHGRQHVDPNTAYSLGSSHGESSRLLRQAEELRATSAALLNRVDLHLGDTAIDVGCGPLGILDLLSERVGPAGRVVGLDSDPSHAAMATRTMASRALANTEVLLGDARATGLPSASFDVVHARTLLINLPEPAEALVEMVRLAKPGRWVLSFEPDCEPSLCYPANPAYDRLLELFPIVFGRNGADWRIGRRLAELYRAAGLTDIHAEVHAELYPPGNTRRTIRVDLVRSMQTQVVELGLVTQEELDDLFADALSHLDDPHTVVMPAVYFLVSGHKPSNS